MRIAITFRTTCYYGDRMEVVEFPISENYQLGESESLDMLVKRIKEHYLPIIRTAVELGLEKLDFKLTDEIIIKVIQ